MEFDPRMTEETRLFVSQYQDLDNEQSDALAEENNRRVKFEDIVEREFFIDSRVDGFKIPVTAYVPKSVKRSSAIVVFFHGGSFQLYSRKTHRNAVAYLADHSNAIWVSVEYRLSPVYKYPTQIEDCLCVTEWVLSQKAEVFGSTVDAKVGVCGDSAGGNAATVIALELKESIAFQILIYPWLDLTMGHWTRELSTALYSMTYEPIAKQSDDYVADQSLKTDPRVSPIFSNSLNGAPKCLLIGAELDPATNEHEVYHKKLIDANVSSESYIIKGTVHNFFDAFFACKNAYIECAVEILRFLNRV